MPVARSPSVRCSVVPSSRTSVTAVTVVSSAACQPTRSQPSTSAERVCEVMATAAVSPSLPVGVWLTSGSQSEARAAGAPRAASSAAAPSVVAHRREGEWVRIVGP
jgi:hypothetical protein